MTLSTGDLTTCSNLRQHFPRLDKTSWPDETLAEEYRTFSLSDMYGDNDARFLEWLGIEGK